MCLYINSIIKIDLNLEFDAEKKNNSMIVIMVTKIKLNYHVFSYSLFALKILIPKINIKMKGRITKAKLPFVMEKIRNNKRWNQG